MYRSTFGARYFSGVSLLCLCHSACLLLCLGVFGFRHSKRERHTTDRQTAERDRETNQDRTLPGTLVGRLECVAADFHLFLYVLLQGVAILFLLSSLTQRPCPMLHGSSLFSFSFNCFLPFSSFVNIATHCAVAFHLRSSRSARRRIYLYLMWLCSMCKVTRIWLYLYLNVSRWSSKHSPVKRLGFAVVLVLEASGIWRAMLGTFTFCN